MCGIPGCPWFVDTVPGEVTAPPAAPDELVTPVRDVRWMILVEELMESRKEIRGVLAGFDELSYLEAFPKTKLLVNDAMNGLRKSLVCLDEAIGKTMGSKPE